ncbi:Lipase [Rubrivivax sp. A210]|uniref:SGNH/GDSL hydrolase family protein n=1 Tax=Rubrivivax sp. A210 TaxID=2772301 RepID=UPI001918C8EC|nr:SGNH/GDSL hydrolase family protein [Rubrivivax sp. A210]CAD5372108.1 Lipase [Rubrivivax sp. A210]
MSLAAKLLLSPLLLAQALRTRHRLPRLPEAAGARQGHVGQGPLLRLLVAGDSSAAGVGVASQHQALAPRLAQQLARACGARVEWRLLARAGLTSAQTLNLLQCEPLAPCDIAVVVTGVNDVVDQVPSHHAVAAREALANHLRNALGAVHVVFAPLPPVHLLTGLPQPLRWIAGADARRHDRALARWVATRADVSRPEVELPLNRGVLADDGFHPGEPVYRQTAHAIALHIRQQVWPLLKSKPHQETPP